VTYKKQTIGIVKRKMGDQSVYQSTTFVDDDTLQFIAPAGSEWVIDIFATVTLGSSSDFKFQFTGPTYAEIIADIRVDQHGGYNYAALTCNDGITRSYDAVNNADHVFIAKLWVKFHPDYGGTFKFRWAQNTAVAEYTRVLATSTLVATRVN